MASIRDIEMYQGETKPVTVTVYDGEGGNQPLSGYDVRYEAETATRIVKDVDDADLTLSASTGVFTFNILPADTSGLTISGTQRFDHEARIQAPDGSIYVVFAGQLIIKEWVIDNMDHAG